MNAANSYITDNMGYFAASSIMPLFLDELFEK
jgi:hypothetical protein